jgi:uncharacterized membrane protein YidH (DUF202 family)
VIYNKKKDNKKPSTSPQSNRDSVSEENWMKAAGIVLIILGIIALVYGGITYTTHKKVLDIGPIQAEKKETHNIPLPPILGVVAIVGGGALLLVSGKSR